MPLYHARCGLLCFGDIVAPPAAPVAGRAPPIAELAGPMQFSVHRPPEPTIGAAVAGGMLWRGTPDGLAGHAAATAEPSARSPLAGVRALAGSDQQLVTATVDGMLRGHDPADGAQRWYSRVVGEPVLVGCAATVWACDPSAGAARRVGRDGPTGPAVSLGPFDGVAAADGDLWWVQSGSGTVACSDGRRLEGGPRGVRAAFTVCANAAWHGTDGALVPVGLWAGRAGPPQPTGGGTPVVLVCAGGRLVGADDRAVFVLDPGTDETLVRLPDPLDGPVVAAVGTTGRAWVLTRHQFHLVTF